MSSFLQLLLIFLLHCYPMQNIHDFEGHYGNRRNFLLILFLSSSSFKYMSLIFGWCFISTGSENLDGTVFCFLIKQYVQLCTTSICQAFKPVAFYITVWFSTYVDQGREKNYLFEPAGDKKTSACWQYCHTWDLSGRKEDNPGWSVLSIPTE